jgi:hypothetical protein
MVLSEAIPIAPLDCTPSLSTQSLGLLHASL